MSKICAVIVSYNSAQNVMACINSSLNQVDKIIVVDNSSDAHLKNSVRNMKYPDKVSFIFNETNKGLGYALNQGLQYSVNNRCEWTLLLDQDSLLSDNMVAEMISSYRNLSDEAKKEVASIIPIIYDVNFKKTLSPIITTNFLNKKIKNPGKDAFVHFQITSGTMVKNEVIKYIGLMNEYFFIDYIDFDYCFRVLNKGYKLLLSKNALLYHKLAEKNHRLFFHFKEHQPFRVYYQTRNRLFTLFIYGKKYKSFLYSESCRFICKFFKILILESNKKEKIKMYRNGIKDFILQYKKDRLMTVV
jgi:rhamnosyltransferase